MVELSKKQTIAIAVIVVLAVTAVTAVFFINGHSLDLRDRDTRIVVTSSMDGSHHPDGCYHCDDCDRDWLPYNIASIDKQDPPNCKYCSSANTRFVSHDYDIEKIPLNALIVVKSIDAKEKQSLKVGDVISFYNTLTHLETVHRIIEIQTSGDAIISVTTSGDNVSGPENVSLSDIHGVVVGESAILGNIVHFAQSSTLLLVMMLVIVIVIISVVMDMYKMSQRGKN